MKYLNYLLIAIGCCIAIYAQAEAKQNELVLIAGIVILMFGVYRISKAIPSKFATKDNDVPDEEE